jgi:hypothetical protein
VIAQEEFVLPDIGIQRSPDRYRKMQMGLRSACFTVAKQSVLLMTLTLSVAKSSRPNSPKTVEKVSTDRDFNLWASAIFLLDFAPTPTS